MARSLELKRLPTRLGVSEVGMWKLILFFILQFFGRYIFLIYFLLVVHQSDPLSRSSWIRADGSDNETGNITVEESASKADLAFSHWGYAIRVCPTAAAGGDYDLGQKWMLGQLTSGYKWCGRVSVHLTLCFEVLSLTLIPRILWLIRWNKLYSPRYAPMWHAKHLFKRNPHRDSFQSTKSTGSNMPRIPLAA